jgi:hypothetical protein
MKLRSILILQLVIVLVVGTGWVKNLIKLADCDFEPSYKAEVIHFVGLIPPVGMITGWLDLGK